MDTIETRQDDPSMASRIDLIDRTYAGRLPTRTPKYLALHGTLADLIRHAQLRPGEQLPSDDEISAHLRLSVGTVQKAMNALRDDGLLERRQGAGTFVVDPTIDTHDIWHFRFLGDDSSAYLPVTARAQSCRSIRKQGLWSDFMPGISRYVYIVRKLHVDGRFYLLSDFYFDGDRFGALTDLPLRSLDRVVLRNVLAEHFNVRTKQAAQHLTCAQLTPRDARMLKVPDGQSGMVLETYGRDGDDAPIYYQRVVIPQTRHKLALDQTR